MKKITVGLQSYTIRSDLFGSDVPGVLRRVKDIGYDAIEFHNVIGRFDAEWLREKMDDAGLSCCGMSLSWDEADESEIENSFKYNEILGNRRLAVSSAAKNDLRMREPLKGIIQKFNRITEISRKAGFDIGYHAHYTDFFMVDGISSWDRIMQGTPEDFCMVIDTGNMLSAGADAIHYLKKYPGRSPFVHLKPYDTKIDSGATMIGEDSFNWPELVDTCIETGGADTLVIEYSNYARYAPFEAAEKCYKKLEAILKEKRLR